MCWADIGGGPELDITWALYRSAGGALIFGVKAVEQQSLGAGLDRACAL